MSLTLLELPVSWASQVGQRSLTLKRVVLQVTQTGGPIREGFLEVVASWAEQAPWES